MIVTMASEHSANTLDLFPGGEISVSAADQRTRVRRPPRQELRFIVAGFARTSLPYQQPKKGTMEWTRKNGAYVLTVQPGMDKDDHGNSVPIGFPSGTIPRLVSCWLATEAVRTKTRTLVLGESMTDFMSEVGIEKASGGPRGTITQLKLQLERLFQSSVSLRLGGDPSRQAGARANVASEYELWWGRHRNQDELLPSTVTLSHEFFEMCTTRPVPVDMRTIQALRGSAMRLDQYWWLTHRMSYLEDETFVPWDSLYLQFGSNIGSRQAARSFRQQFEENLKVTLGVYDKAGARVVGDKGVMLLPGGTDIRPSQSEDLYRLEQQWRDSKAIQPARF